MSTSYYIYTEVKLNDKWVLINGKIPDYKWDWDTEGYTGEYEYRIVTTYSNGSRSYFGETYDKLRDIGRGIKFSQLSDELQEVWSGAVEEERQGKQMYYHPTVVDYGTFLRYANPKVFTRHGVIHKDRIVAFENGDIEELWTDEDFEPQTMTDMELKAYEYYEWDNPNDWRGFFKEIKTIVDYQYNQFKDMNYLGEESMPIRLVVISE